MNSSALPDTTHFPSETSPWEDVRRIYRRICVLRGMGSMDEAANLEHTELARALATARLATENASEESAVLAEEAHRVASAQLLAELVAPILARQLRAELPTLSGHAAAPTKAQAVAVTSISASPAAGAPQRAAGASGEIPGIADFIDSMLSQQKAKPPSPAPL